MSTVFSLSVVWGAGRLLSILDPSCRETRASLDAFDCKPCIRRSRIDPLFFSLALCRPAKQVQLQITHPDGCCRLMFTGAEATGGHLLIHTHIHILAHSSSSSSSSSGNQEVTGHPELGMACYRYSSSLLCSAWPTSAVCKIEKTCTHNLPQIHSLIPTAPISNEKGRGWGKKVTRRLKQDR